MISIATGRVEHVGLKMHALRLAFIAVHVDAALYRHSYDAYTMLRLPKITIRQITRTLGALRWERTLIRDD